jgi:hypothetical protein
LFQPTKKIFKMRCLSLRIQGGKGIVRFRGYHTSTDSFTLCIFQEFKIVRKQCFSLSSKSETFEMQQTRIAHGHFSEPASIPLNSGLRRFAGVRLPEPEFS